MIAYTLSSLMQFAHEAQLRIIPGRKNWKVVSASSEIIPSSVVSDASGT